MRLIRIHVSEDRCEAVAEALDGEQIDFVRQRAWSEGEEGWLIEAPVPADAVGHVLDVLDDAGVDAGRYTVVVSAETARTPHTELLFERFATDFDPLTRPELRSKARDMSQDTRSFLVMILLSAVVATAGLLVESPAIVVGSMVIAPIVGPVLTATVGAATGDREMLLGSLGLQVAGLAVAVAGAAGLSLLLRTGQFVPRTLDITAIELIALRLAPDPLTVVVVLAAGAAGAIGLATKGPTSVIGVMIAAALIPTAATTGIAVAWREPRIAVGSLLLLILTMILINVAAFAVLWGLEYRPSDEGWLFSSGPTARKQAAIVAAVALIAIVGLVGAASAQQVVFDRTVNAEIDAVFDDPDYEELDPVSVRVEYGGPGPFGEPETVTVTVSRTDDGDPPQVARTLDDRIGEATDHEVTVRVRFVEYQRSDDESPESFE